MFPHLRLNLLAPLKKKIDQKPKLSLHVQAGHGALQHFKSVNLLLDLCQWNHGNAVVCVGFRKNIIHEALNTAAAGDPPTFLTAPLIIAV